MARTLARITHDEVARVLKAARSAGVSIRSFSVVGDRIDVVVNDGDSGETTPPPSIQPETLTPLLTEPKL